jgi:DNA-binding response OmpR family regulator
MLGRDILVVEDEIKIAAILKDYLAKAGYRVSCRDRGDTVVSCVRQSCEMGSGQDNYFILQVF